LAIEFVSLTRQKSPDLYLAAIRNNPLAYRKLHIDVRRQKDAINEAVTKNFELLKDIPSNVDIDKEIAT